MSACGGATAAAKPVPLATQPALAFASAPAASVVPGCHHEDTLDRAAARLLVPDVVSTKAALTSARVEAALRMERAWEVWPRALRIEQASGSDDGARVHAWLAALPFSARCGSARRALPGGLEAVIYLSAEHLVEGVPPPLEARTGQWINLDVMLPKEASAPRAYVAGPDGRARALSVVVSGANARARFVLGAPGRFSVQWTADLGVGPRPVMESWVFADVRASEPELSEAAREPGARNTKIDLRALLGEARRASNLQQLSPDASLDKVAQAHANAMARAQILAHELAGLTPSMRLDAAHIVWTKSGENVAHAATEESAHEALLRSPSHRENMMSAEYTHIGIGLSADPHGDGVWACEVFVRR